MWIMKEEMRSVESARIINESKVSEVSIKRSNFFWTFIKIHNANNLYPITLPRYLGAFCNGLTQLAINHYFFAEFESLYFKILEPKVVASLKFYHF